MRSFPWDSIITAWGDDGFPIYDRDYSASDWHEVYKTFFSFGVFMDSNEALQVTAGDGMNVLVSPGKNHINGVIGWEVNQRELSITSASSSDRIDTVVLRWNYNIEMRNIDLYVKTGTASDVPKRAELTRSETVYELGLADIFIPKNTSAISNERITDTRLESERCGVVVPFAKIDTTTFYNQIQAALDKQVEELQDQTDKAIELSNAALNETIAGQLQANIDSVDDAKVDRSGDTMTGTLAIPSHSIELGDLDSQQYTGVSVRRKSNNGDARKAEFWSDYTTGAASLATVDEQGTSLNKLLLNESSSELSKPLTVASGGTGVTTNAAIGLKAYPIGAVYISYVSTSPASLFGGTWTQLSGRFLRMANDVSIGGADSYNLTTAQMPRHQHSVRLEWSNTKGQGFQTTSIASSNMRVDYGAQTGNTGGYADTGGTNAAVSNAPAYQDLYAWRRTA